MSELLSLGDTLVKRAEERGADEAEVYLVSKEKDDVNIEKNQIQIGKSMEKEEVGIRLLVGDRIGFASVNSFEKDDILPKVKEAISIAKTSVENENNIIPEPNKIENKNKVFDPKSENFDTEDSLGYAKRMLESAKDYDSRIQISTGVFIADVKDRAIVNSKGIQAQEKSSNFTYYAVGMAVDGKEVSSFDFKMDGTHYIDEINVENLGRSIAESTVNSLGAKKAENFEGPAIFTPYSLMGIFHFALSQSLQANRVQKGMSKFKGKIGEQVADSRLTVRDDSKMEGGFGCRSFDREGLPTPPINMIKEGNLKNFYHNSYTANKEGKESTGHASGGPDQPPKIGPSNLVVTTGKKSRNELVEEIDKGILVNRFSGNIDPVTGDLSGAVKGGYMIENGEKKFPVKETMISGNIFEMLTNITGISKERTSFPTLMGSQSYLFLPFMRFQGLSFTSD
ncbi:MAG: TldD/PmbA family protein [Candidatus Thermoplasmatota archaeon]|nr:TldD/PmbA family protein [Candidatus Thermoplasmatota archaeon]